MKSHECNFFLHRHSQPMFNVGEGEKYKQESRAITMYIMLLSFVFMGSSMWWGLFSKQRMTVDVRKAVRNSVSGPADRCKALEAHPLSEEGKQVSLTVV